MPHRHAGRDLDALQARGAWHGMPGEPLTTPPPPAVTPLKAPGSAESRVLGPVRHCAGMEGGYFGQVVDRPFPGRTTWTGPMTAALS